MNRAMSNPEAAGRMALWAIELSEFDIQYCPRTATKGQAVAGFVAEYTQSEGRGQMASNNGSSTLTGPQTDM